MIDGLALGENEVVVKATGQGRGNAASRTTSIILNNHPIIGPVFSGPNQYPFVCTTERNGLGQPLVDNDSYGMPVFAEVDGMKTDEIIGVHIMGHEAGEMIATGALAMSMEATVEEICNTIHTHPTLSEVILEAAEDYYGMGIHSKPKRK